MDIDNKKYFRSSKMENKYTWKQKRPLAKLPLEYDCIIYQLLCFLHQNKNEKTVVHSFTDCCK